MDAQIPFKTTILTPITWWLLGISAFFLVVAVLIPGGILIWQSVTWAQTRYWPPLLVEDFTAAIAYYPLNSQTWLGWEAAKLWAIHQNLATSLLVVFGILFAIPLAIGIWTGAEETKRSTAHHKAHGQWRY